ncbi:GGDEF domain-containing protein [Anaerotignum neopropionicum]|uniref:GGDEF domain-containing protein n=1 Tax=Anaerotignum neopropionicum TaxID=36847 RepID=UPI000826EB11|nr:GGDEF domain-containing protein [Anaerotignum neopropionicum]
MKTDKVNEFFTILTTGAISTVYQPIISLENGSVFGYEALSRITISQCELSIEDLFRVAAQQYKLWELEQLCRARALENATGKPCNAKLFINVDPNIIHDPDIFQGFTRVKLKQYGLCPDDIVFEITERSAINDMETFTAAITHYQSQHFKIAIDDFGSGYSGMNRVCAFSPNFIKIDMQLIRNINEDTVKKSAVAAIVKFCKESGIKIIAEGIETEAELKTLIELNIDYGQGFFLSKPNRNFVDIVKERQVLIENANYSKNTTGILGEIGILAKKNRCITLQDNVFEVFNNMKKDITITEVCVLDANNFICGMLTRNYIFERFSGQFGYDLSKRIKAKQIINDNFLAVDKKTPIEKVAELAMERELSMVYDAIVVTDKNSYYGIVTIKDLLNSAISIQVSRAKCSNPLTGLPGNTEIQKRISTKIIENSAFSLIYIDIDNFKPYNDAYGFTMGDQMIVALGNILKECVENGEFVGHIGGDDFVIISNRHRSEVFCSKIIDLFAAKAKLLYTQEDAENGYIVSRNRNGFTDTFSLATISIAVVTNQYKTYVNLNELSKVIARTKKLAKMENGNSIVVV